MARDHLDALVSTQWLADHLQAPDVRVVDASYYLPTEGKDPRAEFEAAHISGAVFFDIDEISDSTSGLPHMLPPPEKFASNVRKLGLGDGCRIVVYDQKGVWSAPRVWWMFQVFGHSDIAVLDGGLPKWRSEGRPVEEGPAHPKGERHFSARFDNFMVRDLDQMRRNMEKGREAVLDARPRPRFEGEQEEPRPGLRKGHIPNSINVPFTTLIDPDTGTMRAPDRLREIFHEAGVEPGKPLVTTCGSGITAAVLSLGLQLAGYRDVALYDGSWAEWGQPDDLPVETGPSREKT